MNMKNIKNSNHIVKIVNKTPKCDKPLIQFKHIFIVINAQLETSYINLVYPLYTIMLYTSMRKGPGSAYDKWNISVVICDTGIP